MFVSFLNLQIDFASKECQAIFFKNLGRTGQASKPTACDNRQMVTVTATSVGPLHRPTGAQRSAMGPNLNTEQRTLT